MHILDGFEWLKQVFARSWRKFVVDEDPDSRTERLRRESIADMDAKVHAHMREAIRLWAIANQKDLATHRLTKWADSEPKVDTRLAAIAAQSAGSPASLYEEPAIAVP
jgi:hypothetical protein